MLFITTAIQIQVFYAVMANQNLYVDERYFPYGYAVHLAYYSSIFLVTFLFVGRIDFSAIGLKRDTSWKKYLTIGLVFGLLFYTLKTLVIQGEFNRSYYLPLELYVPAFIFLGLLIGLAEESIFRGFILDSFLRSYTPLLAVLVSSLLFGIYHVNFLDLNFSWWSYYVLQALSGGLILSVLYIKTGRNLIAPIAYHSTNIIIGQIIPWTTQVSGQHTLIIQSVINLALVALLVFLPIFRTKIRFNGD
jgi:membrane protease YdiL (CAAX protease family)